MVARGRLDQACERPTAAPVPTGPGHGSPAMWTGIVVAFVLIAMLPLGPGAVPGKAGPRAPVGAAKELSGPPLSSERSPAAVKSMATSGLRLVARSLLSYPAAHPLIEGASPASFAIEGPTPHGFARDLVGERVGPFPSEPSPSAILPTTATGSGWQGINGTTSGCSCAPPDPSLAVGSSYVVEVTNSEERVWRTTGVPVLNQSLSALFDVAPSTGMGAPRILYDNLSQTWYASAVDSPLSAVLLAASQSSDPLGPWDAYTIPAWPNEAPQLPSIGTSQWMVGISSNDVNETTGNLDGTGYVLLNRTQLSSGVDSSYAFNPQLYLPNGLAESASTPSALQWFGGFNPLNRHVFWLNCSGAPPVTPTCVSFGTAIVPISAPPPAAQPGTVDLLNTSDGLPTSALWQNGLETLTFTTGSGCSPGLSCLQLVQVWTQNSTVRQDLLVTSATESLFYAAASEDALGDLTVVAGFSSGSSYPSAYEFGQAWDEPGTLQYGNVTVVSGSASVTSACNADDVCPYGEYFAAAMDPNTTAAWTVAEYGEQGSSRNWSTWIASSTTSPPSLTTVATPAVVDVGQESNFTAQGVGGSSPFGNYAWAGLPPGCVSADQPSLACWPTQAGTYEVTVSANDSYPRSVSARLSFAVNARLTISPVQPNHPGADVGQSRTFSAIAALGSGGYQYEWVGLPTANCSGTTAASTTCTFSAEGILNISVTVTDSLAEEATSGTIPYIVSPSLVVGAPTASRTSIALGANTTIQVTARGGSGGDTYSWSGLPAGCPGENATTIDCDPTVVGTFNISATVTDSNGGNATSAVLSLTVAPRAAPSVLGISSAEGWILVGSGAFVVAFVAVILGLRRQRASRGPRPPRPDFPAAEGAEAPPPPPPPE